MGITQQPPVPTPTAKGDIIVGTATGPTKLAVSGTSNQSLVVDSTTTTGLKYATPQRLWTGTVFSGTATVSGDPAPSGSNVTSKVLYANGTYAFSAGRYIWYSTNLITWNYVLVTVGQITTFAVNAAGTSWVVGATSNALFSATTPSGPWTARTSSMSGTSEITKVIWVPSYNLFVLIGNANAAPWNTITTSPDGNTWTSRYTLAATTNGAELVNNLSTTTVASFGFASAQCGAYSTNGTTWAQCDLNDSASYQSTIIWLPTAGRFQCTTGSQRSQTAAAVATAWNTAPTVTNRAFTSSPYQAGTNLGQQLYFPTYDAPNNRWIGINVLNSNPYMFIWDDTTVTTTAFTTGVSTTTNLKIISSEPLPSGIFGGGSPQGNISYVNNTFIYLYNAGSNNFYIWTSN